MTTATNDIVASARETLRARWKRELAEARIKFESDAENAWLRAEKERKSRFIAEYKVNNSTGEPPLNPYADLSAAEAVRVSLDPTVRIDRLTEYGYLAEAVKVHVYRAGGKLPLEALKHFLAPHAPVEGSTEIVEAHHAPDQFATNRVARHWASAVENHLRVIVAGVSEELAEVIHEAGLAVCGEDVMLPRWKSLPADEF